MSIQSEINRISQNVADSLTAVAAKGVTVPTGSTSDDLPELISQIPSGSGSAITITDETDEHGGTIRTITAVSLAGDTVRPDVLLNGYTAHNALGESIVGTASGGGSPTLQDKTVSITPSETAQSQTVTADSGYDGLGEVSVSVGAISSSYVGSGITRRSSSDLTASGATVTVPSGYYSSQVSKAVSSGSATAPASISGTSATVSTGTNTLTLTKTVSVTPSVSAGYISSGTAGNASVSLTASVTTQAAQTIHPSASNQTIASGRYLTGTQTINAVTLSNLTADNIKSGVVVKVGDSSDDDCVTSVTGTYSGGGGSVSYDTKTATASNYPVSLEFSSMKGQPKAFVLRLNAQVSSSGSTTYYYVVDISAFGTTTHGNCFRIGSTRRVDNITSGYSWSYSGTTLTITSSASSRSASPGAFYNGSYELLYAY